MKFLVAKLVLVLFGFLCPLGSLVEVDGRDQRITGCSDSEATRIMESDSFVCSSPAAGVGSCA